MLEVFQSNNNPPLSRRKAIQVLRPYEISPLNTVDGFIRQAYIHTQLKSIPPFFSRQAPISPIKTSGEEGEEHS